MASQQFYLLGESISSARTISLDGINDLEGLRNLIASHFAIVEPSGESHLRVPTDSTNLPNPQESNSLDKTYPSPMYTKSPQPQLPSPSPSTAMLSGTPPPPRGSPSSATSSRYSQTTWATTSVSLSSTVP